MAEVLDPLKAFEQDRDAFYDEWDGNMRSLPSADTAYLRGWEDARRRYDPAPFLPSQENGGKGPWCHHETCSHWFEPQCAPSCGSSGPEES